MAGILKDEHEYYYDAFISYRHMEPDMTVAIKLHRSLEGYRIPKSISRQKGIKKLHRLFRDQAELPTSSNLNADITRALETSRYLIVVCSHNTPKSKWCTQEIVEFKKLHGDGRILTILIEGEPSEAFPEPLRFIDEEVCNTDGTSSIVKCEIEPLAADIRGKNLQEMWKKLKVEKLRLVAPIIGVKFDDLKQRHREQFIKKAISFTLAISLFFAAFGIVAFVQSNIISSQSSELVQKNSELKLQINEKEKQRKLAEKNGNEAIKQAEIALKNQQTAEANASIAEEQRKNADQQEKIAVEQKQAAITERNRALENESIALAEKSKMLISEGRWFDGLKTALASLPNDLKNPDRPLCQEAMSALYGAIYEKGLQGRFVLENQKTFASQYPFSPDGKRFLSVTADGILHVLSSDTGMEYFPIKCKDKIESATFSPDGKKIAVVSKYDRPAEFYNASDGKLISSLKPDSKDTDFFYEIYFSPDSSSVIVNNNSQYTNATYSIWNIQTGLKIRTPTYSNESSLPYEKVLFSPDGKYYIWLNNVIEFKSGKIVYHIKSNNFIINLNFTSDSKRLLVIHEEKAAGGIDVSLIDIGTGNTKRLQVKTGTVSSISRNDKYCLLSQDMQVVLYDMEQDKQIKAFNMESEVDKVKFSPDGRFGVITLMNGAIYFLDTRKDNNIFPLNGHKFLVYNAAFSPDGKRFLSYSQDGTVRMWDVYGSVGQLELIGGIKNAKNYDELSDVYLSRNLNTAVLQYFARGREASNFSLCIYDIANQKVLDFLEDSLVGLQSSPVSPDGKDIIVSKDSNRKNCYVWNTDSKKMRIDLSPYLSELNKYKAGFITTNFSYTGKYIYMTWHSYTSNNEKPLSALYTIDASNGKLLYKKEFDIDFTNVNSFITNNEELYLFQQDQKVRCIDLKTGRDTSTIDYIYKGGSIFTDKNSATLFISEYDYRTTMRSKVIFNLITKSKVCELVLNEISEPKLVSPNGRYLVTSTQTSFEKGSDTLWDLKTQRKLESGCTDIDISAVCFSPDSRFILLNNNNTGIAFVRDMVNEINVLEINSFPFVTEFGGFTNDNRFLATGSSRDKNIHIWDLTAGKKLLDIENDVSCDQRFAFVESVKAVSFINNDGYIFVRYGSDYDNLYKLWRFDKDINKIKEYAEGLAGPD